MIPLFKVFVPPDIGKCIQEVFDSGVITEGAYSDAFEAELRKRFGRPTSLTNSGTAALTLAYKMAGVGPGTEVISTPMTCMATNEPIQTLGAKIVWADINPQTGNINIKDACRKVTDRTVAIVGVAWAGNPFDVPTLEACVPPRVKIIVDAAHAFGATLCDKPISMFGDYV